MKANIHLNSATIKQLVFNSIYDYNYKGIFDIFYKSVYRLQTLLLKIIFILLLRYQNFHKFSFVDVIQDHYSE